MADMISTRISELCREHGFSHQLTGTWRVSPRFDLVKTLGVPEYSARAAKSYTETLYNADAIDEEWGDHYDIVYIEHHGEAEIVRAAVYSEGYRDAADIMTALRRRIPKHTPPPPPPQPDYVRVSFWTYEPGSLPGSSGANRRRRRLDAAPWAEIAENYPPATREALEYMLSKDFTPGRGGQFLLWQGPPGTGKTTALRTLAREWKEWCDFEYVVDPDRFFGNHPEYMLEVLLASDAERWRVLLLEDCGEMLTQNARADVGQGLSRLLNVCDGMIGRGLKVLLLLTTNEGVSAPNQAMARPGRCAAQVTFRPFTEREASVWLERHDIPRADVLAGGLTLADLYAEYAKAKEIPIAT